MIDDSVNKILGYESPIQLICSQINTSLEENILKATQSVGIDVNKEELTKALSYDRGQYKKGYENGYIKAVDDFVNYLNKICSFTFLKVEDLGEIAARLKAGVVSAET